MPADWLWGLLGGLLIGSAASAYLLINGRIMGASGILGGLVDGSHRADWLERGAFLAALVAVPGLLVWGMGGGGGHDTHLTRNAALIIGSGLLTGIGTRLANGCTSGHGVCGIPRLSRRGIVASALYVGAGMAVVTVLRHGLGWL